MNNETYELSINEFRLKLSGNSCEECRPVCQAMCCKYPWDVLISQDEFLKGHYEASQVCLLSGKNCEKTEIICEFRSYHIKKKTDGSCVYLDHTNRCSIHHKRPLVCREWNCSYTFRINPSRQEKSLDAQDSSLKENVAVDLPEMSEVMVPNPLIRLVTVIYNKKVSKLIFIQELISNCGKFYTEDDTKFSQLNEKQIVHLIRLFDKKLRLDKIYKEFLNIHTVDVNDQEFLDIIGLLLKHKIILKASKLVHITSFRP